MQETNRFLAHPTNWLQPGIRSNRPLPNAVARTWPGNCEHEHQALHPPIPGTMAIHHHYYFDLSLIHVHLRVVTAQSRREDLNTVGG
jgi:hypothetical protein